MLYLDLFQIEHFLKFTIFGICKIKPLLIQRFVVLQNQTGILLVKIQTTEKQEDRLI